MNYKYKKQTYYQLTVILTSISENIQNTILLWFIYKNIHNPLFVSLVSFVSYFPMFVSVLFISLADLIHPIKQTYINNILSLILCLLICFLFFLNFNIKTYILLLLLIQLIFSSIRTSNKIIYNKSIKYLFNSKEREKTIQLSYSTTQIVQTISNFINNFIIVYNLNKLSFIFISFNYLLNLIFSFLLFRDSTKEVSQEKKINNNFFFG